MIQRIFEKPEDLLLSTAGDWKNPSQAIAARRELAIALTLPLRKGVLAGNIVDGIFEQVEYPYGTSIEYPLDFIVPGTENEYRAYTIPRMGALPQFHVEGDYVTITTFEIGASIDMAMHYARDARWDVVERKMRALEAMMTKKMNDDGWHAIIAAGADRNIVVADTQAASGQFTKRLVSFGKTVMRRNGGGNSTSVNKGVLTDLFLSVELHEDMRNWDISIIDEVTRREIYLADENSDRINRVFNINLHVIDELGEGQEYQRYYTNELGGSNAPDDLEILVGLDLRNNDSFINPVREPVTVVERSDLAMQRRLGWYATAEVGWGVLDNRRVLILSA